MTAKRRLVPNNEVRSMVELMRELGVEFGAVEVRSDGVVFHPANREGVDEYEKWSRANNGGH